MTWAAKIGRWLLAGVVSLILLTAVFIGGLRFLLPNVDMVREPLRQWVSEQTGFSARLGTIAGQWRNLTPSLQLNHVALTTSDNSPPLLTANHIDLQLDVFASLSRRQPVFSHVTLDGLTFNSGQLPDKRDSTGVRERLEDLFLARLGQFSVTNARLVLVTPSLAAQTLNIDNLLWRNQNGQHHAQGTIGIAGTELEKIRVNAAFTETDGLDSLSGDFYLASENMDLAPWLMKRFTPSVTIDNARLDANAWLRVEKGQVANALLGVDTLALTWRDQQGASQQWAIKDSRVQLQAREDQQWRVDSDGVWVQQGDTTLPALNQLSWQGNVSNWQLNARHIDIAALRPLVGLLSQSDRQHQLIDVLSPTGMVDTLAMSQSPDAPLRYQASFSDIRANQWGYFPAFEGLNVTVSGKGHQGKATLALGQQSLPYGDFFQAPLPLEHGEVTVQWADRGDTLTVWSDAIALQAADLAARGAFRLDIPAQGSPFLALYANADVHDAGQTWRYLPIRAMPDSLTDYLSRAIQGGQAQGSDILWFGALNAFPYRQHDGVFQARVPLRQGAFSFNTAWPTLTELDAELLFENARLTIQGDHVRLGDAISRQVRADIADMEAPDSTLTLAADLSATGDAVRRYMLATPLVDSVGAALTHVQVKGLVDANLALDIPLDGSQPHATGEVRFAGNQVLIQAPSMQLDNVVGRLRFDDDTIRTRALTAQWLGQPIKVDFDGQTDAAGYQLDLNLDADWDVAPLLAQLSLPLEDYLAGGARWQATLGLTLHDIGFDYQLGVDIDTTPLQSTLPAPLAKPRWSTGSASLAATGNSEGLQGRIQLPAVSYQARINTQGDRPVITASQWYVGEQPTSLLATQGHRLDIDLAQLDIMPWRDLWRDVTPQWPQGQSDFPTLPVPTKVNARIARLDADKLRFNQVSLAVRKKPQGWDALLGSNELSGRAQWPTGGRLAIDVDHWHINMIADTAENDPNAPLFAPVDSRASVADKALLAAVPSTDILIKDLWLQGYRLGRVSASLDKQEEGIDLTSLTIESGQNQAAVSGSWLIDEDQRNQTSLSIQLNGDSTSDLMGRFGVSGGIQDARFTSQADISYGGLPWQADITSLNGEVRADIQDGYISGVGGAGKLLGLFSLDSILRKIQLDFSGVFEDGLAFDDITGRAVITNGVVVTDNIRMDGLAGDMVIRGIANLVSNQVNADVRFTPDITSGIPVLSAFAVTPQTALYVLAVTTAISPVVDVFTQVRYQVTGPIGTPDIREISRNQEALTLPADATERLRQQAEQAKE
ncbi:YhdP family protein [Salinivibrio sp. SS2]|uniref:YhdP family protein n=1 Tax=Salinivibrio sp. SS2 TaxID=1892894 RepID=UPI00084C337D|nr:YhdP family protein [Salinivibrio sp. DV]ODQ00392.1 TIGR02099 family protein [Salinivibrio sp. DV]